nr:retrovirus-related Pol polyprotein from transposon TNT 1-94 [Tanacetum cinerariifolium]
MKEFGEAKKILGMKIVRDRSRTILRVSQFGYIFKILNNFRIDNGKSVKMQLGGHFKLSLKDCPVRDCDVERMSKVSYANAVGSLMYLMVCTRPDIAYALSVVSIFLANPGKNHWEAVKWILKYLQGTANVGLVYGTNRGNHVNVTYFVDSDYAKDPDKGRSITCYTFLVQGCVVSWKATLQHVVAPSTTDAEYMALTDAVNEAIWLRGLLKELGVKLNIVAFNCDNQGAIDLSRNHVFHERIKHINVCYHFIKEVLETKKVKVLKVGTEHNATDALTKVVPGLKLQHCLELLNLLCLCVDILQEVDRVPLLVLGCFKKILATALVVVLSQGVKLGSLSGTNVSKNAKSVWDEFEETYNNAKSKNAKYIGEGFYNCTKRIEYEWQPPRIDKLEKQMLDGKLILVNDEGWPIYMVDSMVNENSNSEVEEVFNQTVGFMESASFKSSGGIGYDTKSLLEQCRETVVDNNYDPYNDDMYNGHDISENLQAICDDWDIKVHGRKKK